MIAAVTGAAVVLRRRALSAGPAWELPDPEIGRLIAERFPRFGRFDEYTQIGCAAIFTAAREAGFQPGGPRRDVGFILSGQYGSFATDEAFYATTRGGPELASPNLFSYTLPNIVIGECAAQFGWMGPTFVLDGEGGRARAALAEASAFLESGRAEAMLVGWLEIRPLWAPPGPEGAAVIVLEPEVKTRRARLELDLSAAAGPRLLSGEPAETLDDLLRALDLPGPAPECPESGDRP
ncbi:MAG: beta-ketoacyl synthase N-terminal-like domain-containing protein [Candidatus Aminicenantales bacterium]|jgi:hypothetical protein